MSRRLDVGPDAGFSVVLAVFSILILLTLGIAMVSLVVQDSDLSVTHVQENQAFYAAHAGIEYALGKLMANWSWGGLPSPGETHLSISRYGMDYNRPRSAPADKPRGNVACDIQWDSL